MYDKTNMMEWLIDEHVQYKRNDERILLILQSVV